MRLTPLCVFKHPCILYLPANHHEAQPWRSMSQSGKREQQKLCWLMDGRSLNNLGSKSHFFYKECSYYCVKYFNFNLRPRHHESGQCHHLFGTKHDILLLKKWFSIKNKTISEIWNNYAERYKNTVPGMSLGMWFMLYWESVKTDHLYQYASIMGIMVNENEYSLEKNNIQTNFKTYCCFNLKPFLRMWILDL